MAQYRAAAQLLADQGLTGRLLDAANWLLDPDGGGGAFYSFSKCIRAYPDQLFPDLPVQCKFQSAL